MTWNFWFLSKTKKPLVWVSRGERARVYCSPKNLNVNNQRCGRSFWKGGFFLRGNSSSRQGDRNAPQNDLGGLVRIVVGGCGGHVVSPVGLCGTKVAAARLASRGSIIFIRMYTPRRSLKMKSVRRHIWGLRKKSGRPTERW